MTSPKPTRRNKAHASQFETGFRPLFEDPFLPIWVYDLKTQAILEGNQAALKKFGYTRREFLTLTLQDLCPPEELMRLQNALNQNGAPQHPPEPCRHRRKDGGELALEIAVHPVESGGHRAAMVIAYDRTERMQALTDLNESEERGRLLQGVLQSSSDGILAVNRENQVLFANERFVELWGIPHGVMAKKDDTLLLQFVLDQLSDPQGFLQKVGELYNSAEESFDTLFFKDGRVFDRLSRPMLQGTELRGRVWSFRDITERKQIEDALAASEAELRALFASMDDVALVIDREGVYRKIAPTNPGLLVKPPEELLGRNLKDVFPAEKAKAFRSVVQQVLDTKQSTQIEYDLVIADQTKWFQTTISPLNSGSTLWVAHDISNRKQAERALQNAEANFRSIFENATVGIYQSTPQGSFLSVNPVMARIFGYESPEEMLHSIGNIEKQYYVDPANRHEFQRLLMEHGEVREFVSQNRRKDGGHIWVQENARVVKDADGNILHYEGFITDITRRRQAETALRESEERFHSLFDNATVGMYRTTPDGRILLSNPAGIQMLGYDTFEEISKRNLEEKDFEPEYARSQFRETMDHEGRVIGLESVWRKKDGSRIYVRESATAVRDEKGTILYYDGTFEDITERKQAEEELRRAKNALETANLELQRSLEREKLLAGTDGLTGLCNRRHFFELAGREFHSAIRYQRPLAFLMFDLDDFKQVNDTLGHAAGDQLLMHVAQTASAQVRASDVVARYGG